MVGWAFHFLHPMDLLRFRQTHSSELPLCHCPLAPQTALQARAALRQLLRGVGSVLFPGEIKAAVTN